MEAAIEHRCAVITSTYNEPLITAEWAHDVFELARTAGIVTTLRLQRACDARGARLPRARDRRLQGGPEVVLAPRRTRRSAASCRRCWTRSRGLVERGIWVEVVTLVVPGLNDSPEELKGHRGVPRRGQPGHPVARDRVPPRLPDDRPAGRPRRRRCMPAPRSGARPASATSTRATSPVASATSRTPAARRAARRSCAARASPSSTSGSRPRGPARAAAMPLRASGRGRMREWVLGKTTFAAVQNRL